MTAPERQATFNFWQWLNDLWGIADNAYTESDAGAFVVRSLRALLLVLLVAIFVALFFIPVAALPPLQQSVILLGGMRVYTAPTDVDRPVLPFDDAYSLLNVRLINTDSPAMLPHIEVQDEALMHEFARDAAASIIDDFPDLIGQATLFLNEYARPGQTVLYGIPSWISFESRRWLSFFLLLLTSAEIMRIVFSLTTNPYPLTEQPTEQQTPTTGNGSRRDNNRIYIVRQRMLQRFGVLRAIDINQNTVTWRTLVANFGRWFMRHWNGIFAAIAALVFFWWQPWVPYYGVMSLPSTPVMYLLTAAIAATLQKRYLRASVFFGLMPLFHQETLFLLLLWLTFLYRLDLVNFLANQMVEIFRAPFREGGNPNQNVSWMEDVTRFVRRRTAEEQEENRLLSPLAYLSVALLPYLIWNFLTLAYENDLPFAHIVQLVGNFISRVLRSAPYDPNLYDVQNWRLTLQQAGYWISPLVFLIFFGAIILGGLFFIVQYLWWNNLNSAAIRRRELGYLLVEHSITSRHLWWVFFFGYFLVQTL
ncbi:MAG: hypothetical protein KC496_11525, partial [Anaerolineae bacterium]|nr:hypothetical protein [Anaerolineae bacterium]